MQSILERIGFRELNQEPILDKIDLDFDRDSLFGVNKMSFRISSVYENTSQLIWERSDEYEEDIVTAGLFLLAGSHKV